MTGYTVWGEKTMTKTDINVPDTWDEKYKTKRLNEVCDYLDDSAKQVLVADIMKKTGGTVNPKMIDSFVNSWLGVYEDDHE